MLLTSPLLLEGRIKLTQKTPGELERANFTVLRLTDHESTIRSAPRKSRDLKEQANLFHKSGLTNLTALNLSINFTKDINRKDLLLAQFLKIIDILGAKVTASQPQKRR